MMQVLKSLAGCLEISRSPQASCREHLLLTLRPEFIPGIWQGSGCVVMSSCARAYKYESKAEKARGKKGKHKACRRRGERIIETHGGYRMVVKIRHSDTEGL